MPIVTFIRENTSIEVDKNTILLDAIRRADFDLETPCNAMGFCGKCKVIARGEMSEPTCQESKMIDKKKGERLSCMALVLGDIEIEFLEKEKKLTTVNQGFSIEINSDSLVKNVNLPAINRESGMPYADQIPYKISSSSLYKKLASLERDNTLDIWAVTCGNNILDLTNHKNNILGLAIDIGTTGISYYLINLADGSIMERFSSLNPQTQYGGDVLTRTTYCMENDDGAEKLQKIIVDEINKSIDNIMAKVNSSEFIFENANKTENFSKENNLCNVNTSIPANIDVKDNVNSNIDIKSKENNMRAEGNGNTFVKAAIYHIVIAANTTMNHFLLGVNPASMTRYPYRPAFLSSNDMLARDLSIDINEAGIVSIIPSAAAYIGGDIVSGIVASNFIDCQNSLFIDIGTNGEMAVMKDGKIIATSTAAGPALEGMNIECGCRAQVGAIEEVTINDDYEISYTSIGNIEVIGICGSGLIDIAAQLVEKNILMKSGRWNKNMDARVKARLRDKKFYINDDVYISQKDIRQIQLAKGAIAAGILLMLEEIDMNIGMISNIYIAGAFGYHINAHNILTIGLIPKGFRGDIVFLGNTSLEGARLALINKKCYENMYNIKNKMRVLELSMKKNFQDVFLAELGF